MMKWILILITAATALPLFNKIGNLIEGCLGWFKVFVWLFFSLWAIVDRILQYIFRQLDSFTSANPPVTKTFIDALIFTDTSANTKCECECECEHKHNCNCKCKKVKQQRWLYPYPLMILLVIILLIIFFDTSSISSVSSTSFDSCLILCFWFWFLFLCFFLCCTLILQVSWKNFKLWWSIQFSWKTYAN